MENDPAVDLKTNLRWEIHQTEGFLRALVVAEDVWIPFLPFARAFELRGGLGLGECFGLGERFSLGTCLGACAFQRLIGDYDSTSFVCRVNRRHNE